MYIILKITQLLNTLLKRDEDNADAAWSASNTRAAQKVLRTATSRRGLWIKCCQYIAARSDALPPEYAHVLSKSLDDCPPTPARLVTATVADQLTRTPFGAEFQRRHGRAVAIDDVFEGFDPASPIASASIAQVHVATLKHSGRKVVLKIQHPGIRPMLLQDLEDLKTLLRWIAGAEPKYDMRPILDAWIDMVPLETSFLNEMANLQQVRASLANAPAHLVSDGYVPEPLPELTSDKLFVMEYVDGCKVNDLSTLEKFNVDRSELISQITKSFGNQLFVSSVFSGDPHPGNFLVHKLQSGGVHVLLDFGICVTVSENIRKGFARLILAAIDNDSYSLVQALGDVGVKLNRADPVASLDIIKYLFRTTASREESMKEQGEMKKRLEERNEEMEKNARDAPVNNAFTEDPQSSDGSKRKKKRESRSPVDSFPGDLVFFFRSLGMLRGLAVSLDVRHSYLDTLRPFAEHVLRSQCPPSERMKQVVYKDVVARSIRAKAAAAVLKRAFKALYENDMMIGMQVAAHRNGKLVLNMASGRMGRYDERPVKLDSVFNSFSSTKGLSAVLFASIQDEFEVDYDDLVTKYWPEFGQNGKEGTTVAHILSHAAGLSNALPDDMPMVRLRDDWKGIIQHLEQAAPSHPPGEKSEYHALTFGWLMAGLITKITGKSYQENLKGFVAKHGLDNECFCGTLPEDLLQDTPGTRVATLNSSIFQDLQHGPLAKAIRQANKSKEELETEKDSGTEDRDFEGAANHMGDVERQTENVLKDLNFPATGIPKAPAYILDLNFFNHPIMRSGFVPSANGHFSARALSHIFAAVANDGVAEGNRVLAAGRAAKMQTKFFDIAFRGDRAWGAGLTLFNTVDKSGRELPYGAIGHGGIGGSFAFAVPSEGFSMAITVNKLNALSISAAVVIAVVCRAMDVPMPSWYYSFASKAMKSFDNADDLASEGNLMEKVLSGDGDTDVMKLLVG